MRMLFPSPRANKWGFPDSHGSTEAFHQPPWMSSAEDSPASQSAWLEGDEEPPTSDGSGPSSLDSFAYYDLDTRSWRTSQGSLWGAEWERYSETWPRSGMTRSGTVWRRRTSMPRISATGSSSWPTPDASVMNDGEGLATWLARREREKAKHRNGNGFGTPLAIAVQLWRTPQARDGDPRGTQTEKRASGGHSVGLNDQVGGSLNPTWVEWLMGFPLGWTVLEPSEMPSSRKSRSTSAGKSSRPKKPV